MLPLLARLLPRPPHPTGRASYHFNLLLENMTMRRVRLVPPSRPKPPPESEIQERFLRGSGPGGQKINKTCSAVQLKHIPTGIVVKAQVSRSREQNRMTARNILAQRIDDLENGSQSRSAILGQIKKKKADSAEKKSRRKYRKLDEKKLASAASQRQQDDVSNAEQPEQTAPNPSSHPSPDSPSVQKP